MSHVVSSEIYQEGYRAALIPPPDQPKCPYLEGTPERADWYDGYGDATSDMIHDKTQG